jgi:hypothetical protein
MFRRPVRIVLSLVSRRTLTRKAMRRKCTNIFWMGNTLCNMQDTSMEAKVNSKLRLYRDSATILLFV